jgi:hypothetical protein
MVHSSVLFLERWEGHISCIVLFTPLHIFLIGFVSNAHGGKSTSLMSVWSDRHSWTTRESWRSGLNGTRLFYWDKTFLQRSPLCFTKCAYTKGCPGDLLYDGAFQPLHGRSSLISEQTQDHCVWGQTYTVSCNALPTVCKLKPAHHLLS